MSDKRVDELYRRYGPAIYARCRKLLRDDRLAEDAAQEVFVRVLKHLERAPDDGQALAWMYRISTNYCLNLLRDRRGQAEPVAELPERAGEDAEAALGRRDVCLRVLAHVPEKLSEPALLYYVDGIEQGRIAEILGVSRRTVINRLQEFVERARELLVREEAA